MNIRFLEESETQKGNPEKTEQKTTAGIFSLETAHTLYQMKVDEQGVLLHLYYGQKTDEDMSYRVCLFDRGFSGNPYEMRLTRGYSLDTLPQEYAGRGVGDFRVSAVECVSANGSRSTDLRYVSHTIEKGHAGLTGLPYVRESDDMEVLVITMRDPVIGLRVDLNYRVYPAQDIIVRSANVINEGDMPLVLEKAASACVDFLYGNFDVLHFHGRHCMERVAERVRLPKGITSFGSRRGMSSHHHNPFVVLMDRHATENTGDCYGCMLMYSGNHLEELEVDQTGSTRLVSGIHPDGFRWTLEAGEAFQTPEAILSYSRAGLNQLSHQYHDLIRDLVIDQKWQTQARPVLINSWEAAYFDFDADKILRFAAAAREMGIEMLVLDDGWFGKRDDDSSGLGDWVVNEKKLGCPMKELSEKIHALGMHFGLWFEPEMVSEDSDLYRLHPDWALCDPDRKPILSRNQLVLDMGRPEVVDYIFESMCRVLDAARIEYVKWDFNRSIANCYSGALPPERQGEAAHRFMLGTYELLERLTSRYPSLLIEGCSGGGGRFDAGMLFYCPQIWCSDDTDPVERLEIQRGTSYGYPVSAMGAHVSASPNHQTGRRTALSTRGIIAQAGTFGYELNPEKLTDEEKTEIRQQMEDQHRYADLIAHGDYYRLTEMDDGDDYEAWMFVSKDQSEALVSFVMTHVRANGQVPCVRLQGLRPNGKYQLDGTEKHLSGAALMHGGVVFPDIYGDYPAKQIYLKLIK